VAAGTNEGGISLDVASDPFRCFDVAKRYTEQIILDLQRKQQKGIVFQQPHSHSYALSTLK